MVRSQRHKKGKDKNNLAVSIKINNRESEFKENEGWLAEFRPQAEQLAQEVAGMNQALLETLRQHIAPIHQEKAEEMNQHLLSPQFCDPHGSGPSPRPLIPSQTIPAWPGGSRPRTSPTACAWIGKSPPS
jgi:hypothetical protein